MHRIAILFGLLLIGLGLVGYFSPEKLGNVGDKGTSPTALIPAIFGALLLFCGLIVTAAPGSRKLMMHIAAAVALLGAIGGIMPVRKMDFELASVRSGLLMIII